MAVGAIMYLPSRAVVLQALVEHGVAARAVRQRAVGGTGKIQNEVMFAFFAFVSLAHRVLN